MKKLSSKSSLIFHFALCLAAFAFGGLFTPGEWYESLNRAPWSPPNIAFPIVWSFLYVFIAIAGWRLAQSQAGTLQLSLHRLSLHKLWGIQLFLNALWSWIFFGQHWPIVGLINILMITSIVAVLTIQCFRQQQTIAGLLLSPYLIWLCLATSLNVYVVVMN